MSMAERQFVSHNILRAGALTADSEMGSKYSRFTRIELQDVATTVGLRITVLGVTPHTAEIRRENENGEVVFGDESDVGNNLGVRIEMNGGSEVERMIEALEWMAAELRLQLNEKPL